MLTKIITLALLNFFLLQGMVLIAGKYNSPYRDIALQQPKVLFTRSSPSPSLIPSPSLTVIVQEVTPLPDVPKETPKEEPAAAPEPPKCVITIDSNRYDVTEFSKIHSGGDVFKCGNNMTSDFYSRHDASYLPRMEKYKI